MSTVDLFKFAGLVGTTSTNSESPQDSELAALLQHDEFAKKHLDPKRVVKIIDRGERSGESVGESVSENDVGEAVLKSSSSDFGKSTSSEFAEGVSFTRQESDQFRSVNIPSALLFESPLSKPLKPAIKPYCINEVLQRAHPRLIKSIAHKYGIEHSGNMSLVISEVSKALKDSLYCEEKCGSVAAKIVIEGQIESQSSHVGEVVSSSSVCSDQENARESSAPEKQQVHFAQFGKVRFFDPQESMSGQRKDYIIKMDTKGGSVFKKHSWVSKLFAGLFGS